MWNALAGYAGLVSVGQQAFFGIGAYFAIRLSASGFPAYPSLFAGAVGAALLAVPISYFMLRLRGGEFSIGMWVLAEALHLLINQDPLVQGETGTPMIALNAFPEGERLAATYWLALVSMLALLGAIFILLRSPFVALIQAIRDDEEAAASIGVKVLAAKRTILILPAFGGALAGVLWLATSITFQPKTNFGVEWTAYMILMAGRRPRHLRGADPGALLFFVLQDQFGENGVWYMAGLGVAAIFFALFLPRGLWGEIEARFGLRLLPVGYRVRLLGRSREGPTTDCHSRAQAERQRDPGGAVENQVNPDKKADHPKARSRPFRQHQQAERECYHPVRDLPSPAGQSDCRRADKLKQAADNEEHRHENGQDLGGDHRFPHHHETDDAEKDGAQQMQKEAGPMADQDRLDDFDQAGQHEQPAEEQHRDDGRRHRARDRDGAKRQQPDAEGEEPAPILNELVRVLDVETGRGGCWHVSIPSRNNGFDFSRTTAGSA